MESTQNQSGQQTQLTAKAEQVKQEYKERAIQQRAQEMDMSYINLLKMPINPDLAALLPKAQAESAKLGLFFQSGKKLRVAVLDLNEAAQKIIQFLREQGYWVEVFMCSEESLAVAHKIYYQKNYQKKEEVENKVNEGDLGSALEEISSLKDLQQKIESSSFDVALNYIQVGAYKAHASDVHFQPGQNSVLIRFRVDGILKSIFEIRLPTYEGIVREIKHLSHLKLNVSAVPQDGQYTFSINTKQVNVRVSTLPTHYGEAIVMRLLDPEKANIALESLGFEGAPLEAIQEAVCLSHGMVLVTGPTGSGKSTTLYGMLRSIDSQEKKIITLENPIEYHLEGVSQSQIADDEVYNFASGLRAILRQDPNVIMVGEIRDLETAETAAQASLTGHLVFSTLHTNSALESIPRLVNMGVKPFILAPALNLIVAQRLVRRLCVCAVSAAIDASKKAHIDGAIASLKEKGFNLDSLTHEMKQASGCDQCGHLGYKGQLVISEVLRFDDALRNLILENKPFSEIQSYVHQQLKMITLREDGMIKALKGLTTLEEVDRVAQ